MIRDTSLILQMQLAIIGIVVVVGLFYIWRSTCRMEEKLDVVLAKVGQCGVACCPCPRSDEEDVAVVDSDDAEEFMKQVFGGDDVPMMFMRNPSSEISPSHETPVVVEEVPEPDAESEAETDSANPLSKSKLKRMNVDTLKSLCQERGFSSDGSKTALMNRLLGLSRD